MRVSGLKRDMTSATMCMSDHSTHMYMVHM